MKRLAIDPGDIHVGWAYGSVIGELDVGEWLPKQACHAVTHLMTRNAIDELILEEFVLYTSHLNEQAWSSLQTSQLIGALKWIAVMFQIPVKEQGAYIKNATRNQLRGRGIHPVGKGTHQKDAELHWYYRTLREGR